MEIKKQMYQALSPTQRAVAIAAALNRSDGGEADKLVRQAPRRGGHGKAIIGIRQAQNVYNMFTSRTVREFLLVEKSRAAVTFYCDGWVDAGGSKNASSYRKKCTEDEALVLVSVSLVGELNAVKQAAREWCEKNDVPVEIFSGVMAFLPLSKNSGQMVGDEMAPVNEEMLVLMRSMFGAVKLAW